MQGYAHSGLLTPEALSRAVDTVNQQRRVIQDKMDVAPGGTNLPLYTAEDPMLSPSFAEKVALLAKIDAYARAKDPKVVRQRQPIGCLKAVQIRRADGQVLADVRPMVSTVVQLSWKKMAAGKVLLEAYGGRVTDPEITDEKWQHAVHEAMRMAEVNLESVLAPAGEMTVVLGPGWPGVLLHEAVGHGLEGDFNRKGTSLYSGMMGEMVAAPGVTIVDDGTIPDRRGSLSIDDEGTASGYNHLDRGWPVSRLYAGSTERSADGRKANGQWPSRKLCSLTNAAHDKHLHARRRQRPAEILNSVDKGIFAVNFGGGQVDITNGQFTFQCTEAYEIENGQIGRPVKGATLIGNGPEVMRQVSMWSAQTWRWMKALAFVARTDRVSLLVWVSQR